MPTPLGHSLIGLAYFTLTAGKGKILGKETAWWGILCIVVANIPDIDFIHLEDGAIAISGKWHHGITHSIGFSILLGIIASGISFATKIGSPFKVFMALFILSSLHSIFDLLYIDTYAVNGIGLPLLWPLTDSYFVLQALPPVDRSSPFTMYSMVAIAIEVLLYGGILLLATFYRKMKVDNR